MSYIIAYVVFAGSSTDYPVDCYRTDLVIGDEVLVSSADGALRIGTVNRLLYLNWRCKNKIMCRTAEAWRNKNGDLIPPPDGPIYVGLATAGATVARLKAAGWNQKPRDSYSWAVARSNGSETASISFWKNGVDLEIVPTASAGSTAPRQARHVRHYLSQTTFNLYEGILRFAQSFAAREGNYDRYFKSVGSSEKATRELKERVAQNGGLEVSLYQGLSGCADSSGRIYLGDGVYL